MAQRIVMMKFGFVFVVVFMFSFFRVQAAPSTCYEALNFSAPALHSSKTIDFCEAFKGKTLLVVNTASQCGFTPQFDGLEKLYQKYRDHNFVVVGFPSADFKQEYDDAEKTASICYQNYGVTFPMLAASAVRGDDANDFFVWLKRETGVAPKWNFNKYLIDADGRVIEHYGSMRRPLGGKLEKDLNKLLDTKE